MTVIRLINILEKLKYDDEIYVESAGNEMLIIHRDGKYLGFIDFYTEDFYKKEE